MKNRMPVTIAGQSAFPAGGACFAVRFLFATIMLFALPISAHVQEISSGADYRSMLDELHRDPTRPSQMSAAPHLSLQAPEGLETRDEGSTLSFETNLWRLEVAKEAWSLALTNKQTGKTWRLAREDGAAGGISWTQTRDGAVSQRLGRILSVEQHQNSWQLQVEVEGATPAAIEIAPMPAGMIRLSIRAPQALAGSRLNLSIVGRGPYFGLGERFDREKLDGLRTVLQPEDWLGKPGHNWTYIPVPFVLTPMGFGLFLDTAEKTSFNFEQASRGKFSIEAANASADLYLFAGEPKQMIAGYTSLTGRTPLPPPWAFGVWICSYQGPDKVLDDARRIRQDNLPVSAIWTYDVMDRGDIMGWPLWWTGYYPNPRQFTDQLHGMGFKSLTYVHSYLRSVLDPYNLPNPAYEDGVRNGLLVTNAHGKPTGPAFEQFTDGNIDFTSAASVDWWEAKIRNILVDDNFDGWMEDYGEWVNQTDRFAAGVTGAKMANLNSLFYHKLTYQIAQKAKPDSVEFVRSGYAGSQGYTTVVWGGDQFPNWSEDYGLPSVIRAGITAGISGFAVWAPDIAENGHDRELWTRWVEFGAQTSVMRNHRWDEPEGAINFWRDPDTIRVFRKYAQLHTALFPYLYTFAKDVAGSGLPVMRHPMLEYPNDPNTYDCNEEYLLGDKLLVAPVYKQGARTRTLYLPAGNWTDYWTGKQFAGQRTVTVPAPLEQIPIFVQSGSILPFISPDTETLAADLASTRYRTLGNELTWRVYPSVDAYSSSFRLYDGSEARVTGSSERVEISVQHSSLARQYEIVLPVARAPRAVTIGNKPVPEFTRSETQCESAGWRMDAQEHTLHVMVRASDFSLVVEEWAGSGMRRAR